MTQKQGPTQNCLKLGEDFELDLRAYQLRRAGRALKLEPTPMELLLFLVQHRGELVTRDQIVERIWGKDVFLDTDNSINGAIRKIHQVLKDDPEQPSFIETVSGKGYRFIAPVSEEEKQEGKDRAADFARAELSAQTSIGTSRSQYLIAVTAAVAVLAAATLVYFYLHRKPKLSDKDTIVLAEFTNTTGDPVFDGALRQGLTVQLEQSPFLGLISEERIKHTLGLMGQPVDTRLTPEVAREICERTGSAAVLDGSITSLGTRYVLGLRARNCQTGEMLDQELIEATRKEDVLRALSQIASRFRARVGESLTTIEKHDTLLAEATTPSLEALKAYDAAWKLQSSGSAAVIPLLQRAIEIDPQFALAYAGMGLLYGDVGETDLSVENTTKAYELRGRVSDRERYFISAAYEMQVSGNMEAAQQTCGLWAQTYPRDPMPHAFLSGFVYPTMANYQKAAQEAKQAIALDPSFVVGYWNLAYAHQYLGQLADAENTLHQAEERKLEIPDFLVQRYDIAFLKSDKAGMQEAVDAGRGKVGAEDWLSAHEAFAFAYHGRLREATAMWQRAAELARQENRQEEAALFETGAALREAFFGNVVEARKRATAALDLSKNREVQYGASFSLALAGDSLTAEVLANDLERRFPQDTSVRFSYVPAVRALSALNHREPAKAVEMLQVSVPYELGAPNSSMHGFFGAMYPVYVRGQAYLVMNEGAKAAAEFQKIVDHSGIVVSDPIGVLARLELGRSYALSGERTKAGSAYQDFLTLWKDADPDIPIFKQAKAEYAKIQ
ncbi:MAG TPA: winged helix-turn-helix domain-containing protein [Candidatus Binatia bacterium]|nr:winged helix-turn-helix domain-containing protein [Candidatus Binatia bacterium]